MKKRGPPRGCWATAWSDRPKQRRSSEIDLEGVRSLDSFPVDHYYGPALVVETTGAGSRTIAMRDLEPRLEDLEQTDFLLIRTGWSRFWGTDRHATGPRRARSPQ